MKKIKKQSTLIKLEKLVKDGFTSVNHQLIQLQGDATYTRNEVEKLRSEMNQRFNEVDKKFEGVDKRFDGVDKRFDENNEAHQEILKAIGEIYDIRIARHHQGQHNFATL